MVHQAECLWAIGLGVTLTLFAQVATCLAAAVAAGVLPITAILEAFEPRRYSFIKQLSTADASSPESSDIHLHPTPGTPPDSQDCAAHV